MTTVEQAVCTGVRNLHACTQGFPTPYPGRGSKGRHAGTGEGISAGTGEGISARIHVANSHADRAEDGRRSDHRHSANSLWERVNSCMMVGAGIVVAYAGGRGEGVSLITVLKGSTEVGN